MKRGQKGQVSKSANRAWRVRIRLVLGSLLACMAWGGVALIPCASGGDVQKASPPGEEESLSDPRIFKSGKDLPQPAPEGPLNITVEEAVLLVLERNPSLALERLNPPIQRTLEEEEWAPFDPVLTGSMAFSRESWEDGSKAPANPVRTRSEEEDASLAVSRFFPAGTEVELGLSLTRSWIDRYGDWEDSRMGLNVTQSLLRGRGSEVNLARVRQRAIDSRVSDYELRGFAESLVGRVETTYWDYALEERRIRIFEASMEVVDQQLRETEEMINVGKLAETELTAVEAEKAFRRQDLINARSSLQTKRLELLRLINPPGSNFWKREIRLMDPPTVPKVNLEEVESHVNLALRFRPDMNQARLGVKRQDIEIVRTRNGLLPKMDLFITLGKTGYADSFGRSLKDITEESYDALIGLRFEFPFRNRKAGALHRRALITRDQADKAVENLALLVEMDVRSAYIEVNRTREQIAATAATRSLQEEKLRIEAEKFRVGRSTNFLLAQVHRDLVSSQISEVEAVVGYLKALVELQRLEGSLLERRGILAPGKEAVDPG